MKSSSIHELKKELQHLSQGELAELCIKLSKYKKDNKEYLSYLVFENADEEKFISSVKEEIELLFETINFSNVYLAKKTIRKILRYLKKNIQFSEHKETEIVLLYHFCSKLKQAPIRMDSNLALQNLYLNQVKRISKVISILHEDLQFDYQELMEKL